LQHLKLTSMPNAHLRHSTDPVRLALNVLDDGTITRGEQFEGQQQVVHGAKPVL
jgi:hypothetical protein